MSGKTVLVTGANRGVGLETARALAARGARVVLAVRSVERGEAARRDILRTTPHARLDVMRLDLADLRDVQRFADELRTSSDRLDVLVNNAGFHTSERALTPQGYESTFAASHLGHFLLTRELLPLLEASAPSRAVTVASEAHRGGTIAFDDLMGERRWSGIRAYTQAKLANVLFAKELARRVEGSGVVSHAVHPGSVRTGWARGEESGAFRFVVALASPFLLSPEKGARTTVHVASSEEAGRVNGEYWVRSRVATPSREARDSEVARRLWSESEELVREGLQRVGSGASDDAGAPA
jgi:NAD(P)-dependent dehydrogenase (short-subunit alcohol dehydrogenase family)